jgi:hypothetical protein
MNVEKALGFNTVRYSPSLRTASHSLVMGVERLHQLGDGGETICSMNNCSSHKVFYNSKTAKSYSPDLEKNPINV